MLGALTLIAASPGAWHYHSPALVWSIARGASSGRWHSSAGPSIAAEACRGLSAHAPGPTIHGRPVSIPVRRAEGVWECD